MYWPGGQALARTLLDCPGLVRGRAVLDLGSGCGAASLAALLAGAANVTANDIDPAASVAVRANAELNNIETEKLQCDTTNLLDGEGGKEELLGETDVLLIGDMFYDEHIGAALARLCQHFTAMDKSKTVLLGDPGRWLLSSGRVTDRFKCIAKHSLLPQTRTENYGFHNGFVWRHKQNIEAEK